MLKSNTPAFCMLGLLLAVGFAVQNASACRIICFPDAEGGPWCGEFEGSCPADGYPCVDTSIAKEAPRPDPMTHYILSTPDGRAWTVRKDKRYEIADDRLAAFVVEMSRKYPSGKSTEAQKAQGKAETAAFLKTHGKGSEGYGKVSKSRLVQLSIESGLIIVTKEPKKK